MRDAGCVMDRRDFVARLSAAALVAAGVDPSRIPHPPSRIEKIGLELYTVRDLMKNDVEGTLAKVAAIGYREVEFAGYFNHPPAEIRAMIDRHGLTAPAGHVPFEAIAQGWDQVIDAAHTVGHRYSDTDEYGHEHAGAADAHKHVGAADRDEYADQHPNQYADADRHAH